MGSRSRVGRKGGSGMKRNHAELVIELVKSPIGVDRFNLTSTEQRELECNLSNALQATIPRAPTGWNDECWGCAYQLTTLIEQPNYCPNCGQRINWEVSE